MTTKRKSSTKRPAKKKSSKVKSTTASTKGWLNDKGEPVQPPRYMLNPVPFIHQLRDMLESDPPPHPFWHGVAVISAVLVALSVIAWVFNEWWTQ